MPRETQAVRVARKVTDEVNEYEENIERVVGIYAPHLGAYRVHVTVQPNGASFQRFWPSSL